MILYSLTAFALTHHTVAADHLSWQWLWGLYLPSQWKARLLQLLQWCFQINLILVIWPLCFYSAAFPHRNCLLKCLLPFSNQSAEVLFTSSWLICKRSAAFTPEEGSGNWLIRNLTKYREVKLPVAWSNARYEFRVEPVHSLNFALSFWFSQQSVFVNLKHILRTERMKDLD